MKKILRRTFSILLAFAMLFGATQLGGAKLVPQAAAEYVSGIYTYEVEDGEATITDVDEDISGDITIPSTIDGYPVTRIGNFAFDSCEDMEACTIPNSVTSIGWGAFEFCSGLTSITIPDSVLSIEACAFEYCAGLTSIIIPDSVLSIGGFSFAHCSGLTSITIPDSVTNIVPSVFLYSGYYNDESNWENGVLYIGNYLIEAEKTISGTYEIKSGTKTLAIQAFSYCKSLTDIIIPDSVTNINAYAFCGCTALTEIKIPSELRIISEGCFDGCTSLTKVIMNDALEIIDYSAFSGCSSLKSVKIPNAVENINGSAFRNCCSLETIDLGNSPELQLGYNTFDGCSNIKRFIVGEDVENYSTDDYGVLYNKNKTGLFRYTTGSEDTEYTVDPNTLFIGRRAFDSTRNLEELTLPRDLMQVDDGAFDEVYSLTDVYYLGSEEEWGEVYIEEYGNDALLDATIHFGSYDEDDVDYAIYVNDLTMNYKESKPLDATVVLGTDTEYTVKYYSDSDNVIVDEDTGMLYGAKRGSANITVEATASDDSIVISSDCKVTVEYTWWQWLIKIVLFGWIWY